MPFKLGPWEIGLILVIILIVFGVGRLPQVGSSLGKALHSFRSAKQGEDDEDEKAAAKTQAKPEAKPEDKDEKPAK